VSKFIEVQFGVRQGSILGPILFTLHTVDMAAALGNAPNITYEDNSNAWAIGSSLDVVRAKLEEIAA
jgi:hypothetical protein